MFQMRATSLKGFLIDRWYITLLLVMRHIYNTQKGTSNDDWESWHQQQDVTTTEMPPPQNLQNIQYPSRMPKV